MKQEIKIVDSGIWAIVVVLILIMFCIGDTHYAIHELNRTLIETNIETEI